MTSAKKEYNIDGGLPPSPMMVALGDAVEAIEGVGEFADEQD